ncbi:MAG: hypothetical protein U9O98_10515 [Asgard group archaeon]|nr:hypothetical protein [Asgard group archaeon]
MVKNIGSVLARTFREVCAEKNKYARREYTKVSQEEIERLEKMLRKIDDENYDFIKELNKFFRKNKPEEIEGER